MPDEEHEPTIDAPVDRLLECIARARELVPVEDASELMQWASANASDAMQRRQMAAELIKLDLAAAAQADIPRRLDFYWAAFQPLFGTAQPPYDLLLAEYQLRRARGEPVTWQEYVQHWNLAKQVDSVNTDDLEETQDAIAVEPLLLPEDGQIDDFRILKLLGRGAFARVYLARQVSMQRLVALKVTKVRSGEPQMLSKLDHPNIVRVYDQRVLEDPPGILLYMEFVPGGSLAGCLHRLRQIPRKRWNGAALLSAVDAALVDAQQSIPEYSLMREMIQRLDWAGTVAWIGMQLASALDFAHRQGILHCDVKPANVLLTAEGAPKLVDFNVSTSDDARIGANFFGGTVAYSSPEQLRHGISSLETAPKLDGRSDLYSLGVMLWELWQGERPWGQAPAASSWEASVRWHLDARRNVHEATVTGETSTDRVLEETLRRMLQPDPDQRPGSGAEIVARLRLAFNPQLARRFSPPRRSWESRLLRVPTWLLLALLIFLPNGIASRFNYLYNWKRIATQYCGNPSTSSTHTVANATPTAVAATPDEKQQELPWPTGTTTDETDDCEMLAFFYSLSKAVNWTVFPVGIALFWLVMSRLIPVVGAARKGQRVTTQGLGNLWNAGIYAATLSGILWTISGTVFAVAMSWRFPGQFGIADAVHFFLSLLLCGGVALVYPFFAVTLLNLAVYYPVAVHTTMKDDDYQMRSRRLRRESFVFLLLAAVIPLVSIAALMMRQYDDVAHMRSLVLIGVAATGMGLAFAYWAHTSLMDLLEQYGRVLGRRAGEVSAADYRHVEA